MAFEKLLAIGSWKRNVHRYKDRRSHACDVGLREGKPSKLKVVTRSFVLLLAMLAEGLFLFSRSRFVRAQQISRGKWHRKSIFIMKKVQGEQKNEV